jgi:DNA polymerase-3 subunit alpha
MFVPLRNRSCFTFLDGVSTPKEIADKAHSLGLKSVALVDTTLLGSVEFEEACKEVGIKPIFGLEVWLSDYDCKLALLAKSKEGYESLCLLLSKAISNMSEGKPRVSLREVKQCHDIIVMLDSINGPLLRLSSPDCVEIANLLLDSFRYDLWIEVADQGIEAHQELLSKAVDLSAITGVPIVATNPSSYKDFWDAPTLSALRATALGLSVDELGDAHAPETDQAYIKSEQEIRELGFEPDWITASSKIADRCNVEIKSQTFHFPRSSPPPNCQSRSQQIQWLYGWFPPPQAFEAAPPIRLHDDDAVTGYFRWYATKGLSVRIEEDSIDDKGVYIERLTEEIEMIKSMGFPAYMLIVSEFINWAKDNQIAVGPGRGSVAGSLVAWAMRITDVDPIRFNLFFERFLNPERVSLPDIDIDFTRGEREQVIAHVKSRYGSDSVGQICTYGRFKTKNAIKDAARMCSTHFNDANKWSGFFGRHPYFKDSVKDKRISVRAERDPHFCRTLQLAQQLEGRVRQLGIHAAGVVVTPEPLHKYCAVHRADEGAAVLGADMSACDYLGLVKFDFLGLKTLDVIQQSSEKACPDVDMSSLSLDDPKVYEMLQDGDTLGVFQLESEGITQLLKRLKPETIDHIIAVLALYRPGPLSSGMVDDFVERKNGRSPIEYPHELLEPVLKNTYGVIVYQEQVMQAAQVLAGYSLGEADLLRRAMGKKKKKAMEEHRQRFSEGCAQNNISPKLAMEIFDTIEGFSAYAFNAAHSTAYGLITYQTAWLKRHYPAEFMAACLSWEDDQDRLVLYQHECREMGINLLLPCINKSEERFQVENGAIRYGLSSLSGLGESALRKIVNIRKQGIFGDIHDFFDRVPKSAATKTVVQSLAAAGSFESLGEHREASNARATMKSTKLSPMGQMMLFARPKRPAPKHKMWSYSDRMKKEKKATGLWISGHPCAPFSAIRDRISSHKSCTLPHSEEKGISIVGIIESLDIVRRDNDIRCVTARLSDEHGACILFFFAKTYHALKEISKKDSVVLVHGKTNKRGELVVEDMALMSDVRASLTKLVKLRMDSAEFEKCQGVLKKHTTSVFKYSAAVSFLEESQVTPINNYLTLHQRRKPRPKRLGFRVRLSDDFFDAIERITGRGDAVECIL